MKKTTLKSIGAILVGIAVGAILSIVTDQVFEKTGLMMREPFDSNPSWVIIVIIAYRTIYNIAGAFVTAKLAPGNPMKLVIILGILGLVASLTGTIVMWHIPPHWYPITLAILSFPSAMFGGILAMKKDPQSSLNHPL
ncbi:MAG: hypothetical protein C5B59_10255 [Bacteroidetes bacterium]|nr:MAG: hypothetical protein C5B59_10255 [Bacteroidota bacterium]